MSTGGCATHPAVAAAFRCEGCGSRLCEACVEEGHRLFFCRLCRERAVPLEGGAGATPAARRRRLWLDRPYPLGEALAYPFRGLGRTGFLVYVGLLVALDVLGGLIPSLALASLLARTLIGLLVPGMLLVIVRTSADGEVELPDWPDFTSPTSLLTGWLELAGIAVAALLPLAFFLRLGGCELGRLLLGHEAGTCWPALVAGVVAATAIGAMGLGACGAYESGWLSFRLDLHLLALWNAGAEAWRTVGLVSAVAVASLLARWILGPMPFLGSLAARALAGYALFTGAHLVGVLFRRRRAQLEAVYLG